MAVVVTTAYLSRTYERHRAGEDNPYRIGDEVHLRQRPDTGFPGRGVVVSIFPERDGEPTYHVRFPGQADATPLRGRQIGPTASFPAVTTNQGTAASLAAAERLLIETAARIRACEQRRRIDQEQIERTGRVGAGDQQLSR